MILHQDRLSFPGWCFFFPRYLTIYALIWQRDLKLRQCNSIWQQKHETTIHLSEIIRCFQWLPETSYCTLWSKNWWLYSITSPQNLIHDNSTPRLNLENRKKSINKPNPYWAFHYRLRYFQKRPRIPMDTCHSDFRFARIKALQSLQSA